MASSSKFRGRRDALLPIGIIEQHLIRDRELSAYDIAEKLIPVQDEIDNIDPSIGLDTGSVLRVNRLVAVALSQPISSFAREDEWESLLSMIEDCGGFAEDPGHITGWILSSLYWDHLDTCRFSTAWLYTDAIRVQYNEPKLVLPLADFGGYLRDLAGSGPPINDGQTFFPSQYGSRGMAEQ